MMLSIEDFAGFFDEVYGYAPFPWQQRLLTRIAANGEWPRVLDLPTGSGKTAAIDVAVFHLALQAEYGEARRAPVRIAFVVDRRLVVDDAYGRAQRLERALSSPQGPITESMANRLSALSGDGRPLVVRRLRGGIPREDDWARTPSQPTVLCSTVDQIGSRLLFRGYGVSDSMKPVHAGLIGSDCLILLDEAHLANPLRQTLEWVRTYRSKNWRESPNAGPWGTALLTATLGEALSDKFQLEDVDREHPVLKKRLEASKRVRLVSTPRQKPAAASAAAADEEHAEREDLSSRVIAITTQVQHAFSHFKEAVHGARYPAIGVVVNRVARARAVLNRLREDFGEQIETGAISEPVLMIGPARPVERDGLVDRLEPIRTRTWGDSEERSLDRALILVSTQCIEAGVDIDLDALITEAAPLDCLRQRFGRLNRAGRNIVSYSAIVASRQDIAARTDDPVYGTAIKPAWDCLLDASMKEGRDQFVEFGVSESKVTMCEEALAHKEDAPILLPAHLDLLTQTSPVPAADPEVGLYLHGTSRKPDSISLIWRAAVNEQESRAEDMRRLLMLVPPRSLESIELPLWAVRRWLEGDRRSAEDIPDVSSREPDRAARNGRRVFRWRGDDETSRWVDPADLRPGDTVIVPTAYGGVDEFGWKPTSTTPAEDVARAASRPFAGHRFAVRIAPGLIGALSDTALADTLAGAASLHWQDLRDALLRIDLPPDVKDDLDSLDTANRPESIRAYMDLYGTDDGRARGIVFVAPFGIRDGGTDEDGRPNSTEDDTSGSIYGLSLSLRQHSADVERKAEIFARAAGLRASLVTDLKVAGYLHDAGKADNRFQAWLHYGDPLGADPDDEESILAKSPRPLPRRARTQSGLPEHWRHEALSVRLARNHERLKEAKDPELVLWLVGSHHGFGRPFFPHHDPMEIAPDVGPQSLAFDWKTLDWPSLFERLKARYGVWELARLEAILRLADHRASEDRIRRTEE